MRFLSARIALSSALRTVGLSTAPTLASRAASSSGDKGVRGISSRFARAARTATPFSSARRKGWRAFISKREGRILNVSTCSPCSFNFILRNSWRASRSERMRLSSAYTTSCAPVPVCDAFRRRALHHLVGGHDVHGVHVVEHHLRGILVHGLHRVAPRHVHGGGALRLARRVVAGGQRGHQLVDALAQLPHESPSIRAEGCSAGSDGCPSRSSASPRAGCASIGECFT